MDYPFFVDVRQDGLDQTSGMNAGLDQVTLTWPSPIALDEEQNQGRRVIRLAQSTEQAWTTESLQIQPDYQAHGELGFPPAAGAGQATAGGGGGGPFRLLLQGQALAAGGPG